MDCGQITWHFRHLLAVYLQHEIATGRPREHTKTHGFEDICRLAQYIVTIVASDRFEDGSSEPDCLPARWSSETSSVGFKVSRENAPRGGRLDLQALLLHGPRIGAFLRAPVKWSLIRSLYFILVRWMSYSLIFPFFSTVLLCPRVILWLPFSLRLTPYQTPPHHAQSRGENMSQPAKRSFTQTSLKAKSRSARKKLRVAMILGDTTATSINDAATSSTLDEPVVYRELKAWIEAQERNPKPLSPRQREAISILLQSREPDLGDRDWVSLLNRNHNHTRYPAPESPLSLTSLTCLKTSANPMALNSPTKISRPLTRNGSVTATSSSPLTVSK